MTATDPVVFLSYARPDKGTARLFAEAFQGSGLSVWWDDSLRSGETFDEAICEFCVCVAAEHALDIL